ncbi:MAG: hypothetical protein JRE16_04095 [Deltaproteobacteria bacterium]|jgi:hypothetical protein|nr:hypothetical protein [Deltaproteobacteria bacterium]MBW2477706.1 hypothetical protein [Deltaproteobacteria bacterium]MBW2503735.1 hypothetical protein [Deltaproteobacteria bacterium]
MTDKQKTPDDGQPSVDGGADQPGVGSHDHTATTTHADQRFPELAELEDEIKRRIQNNRRFLERFMNEDFVDEDMLAEDDAEDQQPDEEG